jgi:hypothetical protein
MEYFRLDKGGVLCNHKGMGQGIGEHPHLHRRKSPDQESRKALSQTRAPSCHLAGRFAVMRACP